MHCSEARRLLDQGVIPGSTRGRNPQLGFHLAGCAECRAYREQRDQQLLTALVAAPTVAMPTALTQTAPLTHSPPPSIAAPPKRRQRLPYGVWLMLGTIGIVLLATAWYFGLPLYRAMRLAPTIYRPDSTGVQSGGGAIVAQDQPSIVAAIDPTSTATATLTPQPPTATSRLSTAATPSMTPTPTATATPAATPTPTLPDARAMTVLLLGVDARPGEGLRARSDALMLARIDPQQGTATLLSMPRDMWVSIPGYGQSKVNSAFFYGESAQPGGGLALAKQTIGGAFNVQVDHAVVIDFAGFRSLIDALGGITVDVPKEIYDGQFPTDDYGYMVAHFEAGPQQMDGARALVYARTRHPDSDFERIKRQQLVLVGIANRLKERGTWQNLHEADMLTAALTPYIQTDMPPDLVLSMLWSMRDIDTTGVRRLTVDGSMLWETSVNGAYALVPPDGTLQALGQQLLQPPAP